MWYDNEEKTRGISGVSRGTSTRSGPSTRTALLGQTLSQWPHWIHDSRFSFETSGGVFLSLISIISIGQMRLHKPHLTHLA